MTIACPRTSGFSILECFAAVVILGTSLLAGVSLFGAHEQVTAANEATRQAHSLLDREAERVRCTAFSSLETTDFEPIADNTSYEVRRVVVSLDSKTRSVTIEVRWTTPWGTSRTDSTETIRSEGIR